MACLLLLLTCSGVGCQPSQRAGKWPQATHSALIGLGSQMRLVWWIVVLAYSRCRSSGDRQKRSPQFYLKMLYHYTIAPLSYLWITFCFCGHINVPFLPVQWISPWLFNRSYAPFLELQTQLWKIQQHCVSLQDLPPPAFCTVPHYIKPPEQSLAGFTWAQMSANSKSSVMLLKADGSSPAWSQAALLDTLVCSLTTCRSRHFSNQEHQYQQCTYQFPTRTLSIMSLSLPSTFTRNGSEESEQQEKR